MRIGTVAVFFVCAAAAVSAGQPDSIKPNFEEAPKTAASTVPAPAEAAGYTTRTFGPEVALDRNWHRFSFFGVNPAAVHFTPDRDGHLTIAGGGNNFNAQISTAGASAGQQLWHGVAFGGGAYFEATFSFKGPSSGPFPDGWPAWWANDIESMSRRGAPSAALWPGQGYGYGNWIEPDFAEFQGPGTHEYGIALHNWYGVPGSGRQTNTQKPDTGSPVQVPDRTDFSQPHRYGFLWVPADAKTQGYAKWFFDDVQVGKTVYWNRYDPKLPPPPVPGSSAYSVLDVRHLALILGTGPSHPMTIYAVSVWQKSADQNLVRGRAAGKW